MPLYDQKCTNCGYEWEDFYKVADPVPPCPKCGSEAKKLLSAVYGSVELTGQDLVQKVKREAVELKNKASRDEKTLANLVGEKKYNDNKNLQSKLKDSLKD